MMIPFVAAALTTTPACAAKALTLSTDARQGDLNGMSHTGTYLVIRNTGRRACRLPGLPTVSFRGANGTALAASRRLPIGMNPGPVVMPVTVPPGGSVAAGLRWVSGPVYDSNRRLDIRSVGVTVGGRTLRTPLRSVMFAQTGQPALFDQPPLAPFR